MLPKTRPNIKIRTISWNMHDSVPTGDLSELLGALPSPSATPQPTTTPGVLPQFDLNALHPYHILMICGQECPSSRDILGTNTLSWTDRLEEYLTHGAGGRDHHSSSNPPSPSDIKTPSFTTGSSSQTSSSATKHFQAEDALNGPYTLVAKERLLGIYLAVFVHTSALNHLTATPSKSKVTAGLVGGRVGNKGGVGISLLFAGHSFLFVAAHLAAHADRLEERKLNVRKIADELDCDEWETGHWDRNRPRSIAARPISLLNADSHDPLPPSPSHLKDFGRKLLNREINVREEQDLKSRKKRRVNGESAFDRYDYVFFAGDLNFRLEISRLHADWLMKTAQQRPKSASSSTSAFPSYHPASCLNEQPTEPSYLAAGCQDFSDALQFDQLKKVLSEPKGCFEGFEEAEIRFAPTYKYDLLPPLKSRRGTAVPTSSHAPLSPALSNALHLYIPRRTVKPPSLCIKSSPIIPHTTFSPSQRHPPFPLRHFKPSSPTTDTFRFPQTSHPLEHLSKSSMSQTQSSALISITTGDQRTSPEESSYLCRTRSLASLTLFRSDRTNPSVSSHLGLRFEKVLSFRNPLLKLSPPTRCSTAPEGRRGMQSSQSCSIGLGDSLARSQPDPSGVMPSEPWGRSANKSLDDVRVEEIEAPSVPVERQKECRQDSQTSLEQDSVWDSSGKQRVQSWTDRILYRSNIRVADQEQEEAEEVGAYGKGSSASLATVRSPKGAPTSPRPFSGVSNSLGTQPRLQKLTKRLARVLRMERLEDELARGEEDGSQRGHRHLQRPPLLSRSRSATTLSTRLAKSPPLSIGRYFARRSSTGRSALPMPFENPEVVLCPPTLKQPSRRTSTSRPPLPASLSPVGRTRAETSGTCGVNAFRTPRVTKNEANCEGQAKRGSWKRGRAQSAVADQVPPSLASMMTTNFLEQTRDRDWASTFSIRNWFQSHLQELIGTVTPGLTEDLRDDEEVGPRLGECICLAYYSVNDLRAMEAFSDHRPVVGVFVVGIAAW